MDFDLNTSMLSSMSGGSFVNSILAEDDVPVVVPAASSAGHATNLGLSGSGVLADGNPRPVYLMDRVEEDLGLLDAPTSDSSLLLGTTESGEAVEAAVSAPLTGGIVLAAVAGLVAGTAAVYAYERYANSGNNGEGSSGPPSLSRFMPAAFDDHFGGPDGPGNRLGSEVDQSPNLNLSNVNVRNKLGHGQEALVSYFARDEETNSAIDWDGFYLKSWEPANQFRWISWPNAGDDIIEYQTPLHLDWATDRQGNIYVPEILAVRYRNVTTSSSSFYCFGPATFDVNGLKSFSNGAIPFYAGQPSVASSFGLHGFYRFVDGSTGDVMGRGVVDLRNTRGDGIFWIPKYLQIWQSLVTADTAATASFLYRYRRIDWKALFELVWKWQKIARNYQRYDAQETAPQAWLPRTVIGERNLVEFNVWYLFWGNTVDGQPQDDLGNET